MSLASLLLVAGVLAQPGLPPENPRTLGAATEDGVVVRADYYAAQQPNGAAVILLHMYGSDRQAWGPLVPVLLEQGYGVLALDLRGHGESTYPPNMNLEARAKERDPALFNAMHHDVAAAYSYLAHQNDLDLSRFAIIGASVGCSVAMDYATRDPSVDVVICLSPGTNYLGVDSKADIAELHGRSVWLVATEDERKAVDQLALINPTVQTAIVGRGRIHGTRMFGEIDGIEQRIVNFLNRNIGQPTTQRVRTVLNGEAYFSISTSDEMSTPPRTLRWLSSVEEAQSRGLNGSDSAWENVREDSRSGYESSPVPLVPPPSSEPVDPK